MVRFTCPLVLTRFIRCWFWFFCHSGDPWRKPYEGLKHHFGWFVFSFRACDATSRVPCIPLLLMTAKVGHFWSTGQFKTELLPVKLQFDMLVWWRVSEDKHQGKQKNRSCFRETGWGITQWSARVSKWPHRLLKGHWSHCCWVWGVIPFIIFAFDWLLF